MNLGLFALVSSSNSELYPEVLFDIGGLISFWASSKAFLASVTVSDFFSEIVFSVLGTEILWSDKKYTKLFATSAE